MLRLFGDNGKCLCPLCLEAFYPEECRIISRMNPGKELKRAPDSELARWWSRMTAPEPLTGDVFTRELASRECPHCRYLLPYNIEWADSKIIAVVGDTFSGKSHFIAALIRQIQDGDLSQTGRYTRFVCLTTDLMCKYTDGYLDILFKKKLQLAPNQPATDIEPNEPLIYELIVRKSPQHPAKKLNLIFYDVAGEDQAIPERLVQYSHYVLKAGAIIFLADPQSIPAIYDRLPKHLQYQAYIGRRASDVFNSVIQLFERSKGVEPGSRLFSVPIAITLSKSDLLKYLTGINQSYTFSSHPKHGYGNGIDLEDVEIVDAEVRDLLDECGDRTLLNTTQGLNAKFFATSATGHAPNIDGTYAAVDPRRCLDPVYGRFTN